MGQQQVNKHIQYRRPRNRRERERGRSSFDPAIPLLRLYPKNPKTLIQKNLCTPLFIATQFTIAKYWEQSTCPSVNEWIKNSWYFYMMEYYTAERKKELLPFSIGGTAKHYAR